MNHYLRGDNAIAEHIFNPGMAGGLRLGWGQVLLGRSGLMPTQRPQRPCGACHFAPPLLDAHSILQGVTGLRCSSAWIVAARVPVPQVLDGPYSRDRRER